MKKILSIALAVSAMLSCSTFKGFAEEAPAAADVDEIVYAQLLKNKWSCDKNSDGIITDEELAQASQLSVNLEGIKDLSWLTKLTSCHYLTFTGGEITDFSVLKDLPALDTLHMNEVPVTDISFIKELDLKSCWFYKMDQITPEQKVEVLRFSSPEFWEGTSGKIGCFPYGFAEYEVTIEDKNTAVFMDGTNKSIYEGDSIYGVSAGKTAFTVSYGGKEYYKGEITVKDSPDAYNPSLHNTEIDNFENGYSSYYNLNTETENAGLVTLVNGTLYSVSGSEVKIAETDVADYEHVYKRSYSGSYNYADMVLKTDGTLLVNGSPVTDIKVKAMREGYFLGENGYIYSIVPKGDTFTVASVTTESKGWVDGCDPLFVTKDGHLKYYSTKLIGDGKQSVFIGNTNIGEPKCGCKIGSACYVLDKARTLYQLSFSGTFTKTKVDDDVLSLQYDASGFEVEYTKANGETIQIKNIGGGGGPELRAKKYLGIDAGTFYIHEYTYRDVEENDAVISYYIDKNHTLSSSFLGEYFGLTNVKSAIGSAYDSTENHGYLYFLRTDGSIWKYNLDTKQWQEASVGTNQIVVPQKIRGDVNADGKFNISDVVLLQKWILALNATNLPDWKAADLNNDDRLNSADLAIMKRELINLTRYDDAPVLHIYDE